MAWTVEIHFRPVVFRYDCFHQRHTFMHFVLASFHLFALLRLRRRRWKRQPRLLSSGAQFAHLYFVVSYTCTQCTHTKHFVNIYLTSVSWRWPTRVTAVRGNWTVAEFGGTCRSLVLVCTLAVGRLGRIGTSTSTRHKKFVTAFCGRPHNRAH